MHCWGLHGLPSHCGNLRPVWLLSLSWVAQQVKAEAKDTLGLLFILPGAADKCGSGERPGRGARMREVT